MNTTEIKKELYKQKPVATLMFIRKGYAYYYTDLEGMRVNFDIPIDDMGEASFSPNMDAKLLCRWITLPLNNNDDNV